MRTVFGLVELDAGSVRSQGAPIGPGERRRFGYMGRSGLYPRMRVREQLVYLGELCGRPSDDVARTVDTWLERLSLGDRAGDRLDVLSHGDQQRVQLVAALVNEPEPLDLDEPFSGLDPVALRPCWATPWSSTDGRPSRSCGAGWDGRPALRCSVAERVHGLMQSRDSIVMFHDAWVDG